MAAPGRRGPGLAGGPGLLRASPARIAHNGPSPPAGALYCLPLSAALQPLLGPLGWIVTLAPGLLLATEDKGERDNSHYCDPFSIRFQWLTSPFVNFCNFPAILADCMRG
jgi:hypothetical protein